MDKPICSHLHGLEEVWREGFQSTWLPGVTFTKALASAIPGDECGLEAKEGQSTLLGIYYFSAPPGHNNTGKRHVGKAKREAVEGGGAEGFLKCVRQMQLARSCGIALKH